MHLVTGLIFALSLFAAGSAQAASAAACDAYAKEAAAHAQGAKIFDCGFDLKDPRWTTDRKSHATWCRASPEKAVATATAWRRGEIRICEECRVYARFAVDSTAENNKLKCGLSGPRWNDTVAAHFDWCMGLRDNASAAGADIAASYKSIAEKIEKSTHSETLERIVQIAACKSR